MKNYIIIGLSFLFVLGTASCDDWLEMKPENEIVLEDFWKTKTDVESVLSACYRSLSERAAIERMIVWGELRSDNMVGGRIQSSDMTRILDGNLTSQNTYANWGAFYSTINICNTLLYYAPQVLDKDQNFTQRDLNLVRGEAITLRALAYFYLVRAFRDVPLITDPSINDTQDYNKPQDAEQVVLDFIISDLKEAISNNWLRDSYGDNERNKGRITQSAANALLADIYLWKDDYENCIKCCDKILANTDLKLIKEKEQMYSQVFYRKNSTESIFEIQFDEDDMKNLAITDWYCSLENYLGYISFPPALGYDLITGYTGAHSPFNYKVGTVYESVKDIRSWNFIRNFPESGIFSIFKYGGRSVTKTENYKPSYYNSSVTSNWIVYRLSDIMLLKAEALVQQGKEEDWKDAVSLINAVYLRSNEDGIPLNASLYTTKFERERLVMRERQRELLFEGKRWFDLMRMARREKDVTNLNLLVTAKRDDSPAPLGALVLDAIYMPVAKSELDANKNLVQNKFYKESETTGK